MPLFRQKDYPALRREVFGIEFPHPVALSPGFLPNGERYNTFRSFSFVEIGPLTIQPQEESRVKGIFSQRKRNSTPAALSNKGIRNSIDHIQSHPPRTRIAANIAPMSDHVSTESIVADMTSAFSLMYDFADMFVVDTFRQNSDGVAPLQNTDILSEVMDSILDLRRCYDEAKPIVVRVSTFISRSILSSMLDYMRYSGIDGVIAGYDSYPLDLVKDIARMTDGRFPVIACGNIDNAIKAEELLSAGASLVQVTHTTASSILSYLDGKAKGTDPASYRDSID